MATVGARSRIGGYVALLAVLVAPEAAISWTSTILPAGWEELTSIPAACSHACAWPWWLPGGHGSARRGAAAALGAVVAVSMGVMGMRAARMVAEPAP